MEASDLALHPLRDVDVMSADELGPISEHTTLDRRCERCPDGTRPNMGKVVVVEHGAPIWACHLCAFKATIAAVPTVPAVEALTIPEPVRTPLPRCAHGPGPLEMAEQIAMAVLLIGAGLVVTDLIRWAQRVL